MAPDIERGKLCAEAIAEILKQYNCMIIPEIKIIGEKIAAAIHVIAQDVDIDTDGIKKVDEIKKVE